MKLYSARLAKQLRRGVKKRLRESKELRREYQRAGRIRTGKAPAWAGLALFILWLASVPARLADETDNIFSGLALLSLMLFIVAAISAPIFVNKLRDFNAVRACRYLPMDDSTIFQWQVEKGLKAQVFPLLLFLLGSLAEMDWRFPLSVATIMAIILIAVLACVTQLALVIHCAARLSRGLCAGLGLAGFVLGVAFFIEWQVNVAAAKTLLDNHGWVARALFPVGWALSLVDVLGPNPHWKLLALLVPIAFVIFTAPLSLRRLWASFGFGETETPDYSDLFPNIVREAAVALPRPIVGADSVRPYGHTEIVEMVLSRQFLSPASRPHGLSERWFWRMLSPREQVLADLAFPGGVSFLRPWSKILGFTLVAATVGFLGIKTHEQVLVWISGLLVFGVTTVVLASMGASGTAFGEIRSAGVLIPRHALFAVSYEELSKLLLKYSLAQFPMLLVFTTTLLVAGFWATHGPVLSGAIIGCKAAVAVLAGRFLLLVFRFSGGSNDTSNLRVVSLLILAVVVVLVLGYGVAVAVGLAVQSWIGWVSCGIAVLDAAALHRIYQWFHNRNYFDLMRVPTQ